jgi:hypothetical protein
MPLKTHNLFRRRPIAGAMAAGLLVGAPIFHLLFLQPPDYTWDVLENKADFMYVCSAPSTRTALLQLFRVFIATTLIINYCL